MFSNAVRQKERSGKYGTARDQYLQDLVTEFQQTVHEEAKEQVVAHLANFAYDPFNFGYLRMLNVLELFLDCLTESNEKLVEYALGGICNCVADPTNAAVIVENGGIPQIIQCLSSPVENTVLSAIATLYYICTPATKKDILKPEVVECINKYANVGDVNIRFSNLAQSFLATHFHQIYLGKKLSSIWWGSKTHKILMVGLDSAGKTTILYQLKLGREVVTISTIGYNVETIQFDNVNLTVWDLGGWTNNPFWVHYLPDISGLIFVVDLNDKERIHEARDKLHRVLSDDPSQASLLVLANKQDIPEAMSIPEVTAALDLHKVQDRKYFVQGCCAKAGEGLCEGLQWLTSAIGKLSYEKTA